MSMPSLRQPKMVKKAGNKKPLPPLPPKAQNTNVQVKQDFLIVTLKGGKKLVVSSDAYHGILTAGELYRCVFCETEMTLDILCKERHKGSQNHRKVLENYPHLEEYKENLIRKITAGTHYCTICNVVVLSHFLHKHLDGEAHLKQLEQAFTRSETYMPTNDKNSEEFPPLRVPK